MENLKKLHPIEKEVSAVSLFKFAEGDCKAIQILKDQVLKEHITKVPALLICVIGNVIFENENGMVENLSSGDYVHIEPILKHWVSAKEDSQLILLK